MLVKYVRTKDGKVYTNLGIKLENGYVVPIQTLSGRDYYQLLNIAKEIKIEFKKGDKK